MEHTWRALLVSMAIYILFGTYYLYFRLLFVKSGALNNFYGATFRDEVSNAERVLRLSLSRVLQSLLSQGSLSDTDYDHNLDTMLSVPFTSPHLLGQALQDGAGLHGRRNGCTDSAKCI